MVEKIHRSRREWTRRYVSFIFILFIIALGTSLSIRANLGSSPISAPPYVLSLVPGIGLTMGQLTICMHVFFILSQIVLLRKDYEKRQLTQILVSFLFGFYTDLTMWLTSYVQIPFTLQPWIGYPLRFIELVIGGSLLAFGIACEVRCDSLMLAGEGFPLAIAKFLKKDFGKVKICSDTSLVIVGVIFMYIFFGHWEWKYIGVGTLFSMFFVGFMVRQFSPHISWLDRIFIPADEREAKPVSQEPVAQYPVITIAREYGSGGRLMGKQLSNRLHIPYYDREIIDETAKELGYSPEVVARNEQNISSGKLWELIFTDKSIPPSMNPSEDDAIFVAESRTIRALAQRGPCIIIGRLANWIFRDSDEVFRIFVTSGEDSAVKRVMEHDHLDEEQARQRIEQVNKGRANHYWQYTGQQWKDINGYDLIVNTDRLGIDGAADVVVSAWEKSKKKPS
ncbi:MAG: DUF6198 family protein [Prevotella sp.]|jgi:uncharacterized membrane protein YczE/cytidylate kinase